MIQKDGERQIKYKVIALIALGKKLFLCLSVLVLIEMNRPLLRLEKQILSKRGCDWSFIILFIL